MGLRRGCHLSISIRSTTSDVLLAKRLFHYFHIYHHITYIHTHKRVRNGTLCSCGLSAPKIDHLVYWYWYWYLYRVLLGTRNTVLHHSIYQARKENAGEGSFSIKHVVVVFHPTRCIRQQTRLFMWTPSLSNARNRHCANHRGTFGKELHHHRQSHGRCSYGILPQIHVLLPWNEDVSQVMILLLGDLVTVLPSC